MECVDIEISAVQCDGRDSYSDDCAGLLASTFAPHPHEHGGCSEKLYRSGRSLVWDTLIEPEEDKADKSDCEHLGMEDENGRKASGSMKDLRELLSLEASPGNPNHSADSLQGGFDSPLAGHRKQAGKSLEEEPSMHARGRSLDEEVSMHAMSLSLQSSFDILDDVGMDAYFGSGFAWKAHDGREENRRKRWGKLRSRRVPAQVRLHAVGILQLDL
eukprot:CAMPEP_0173427834 /NCGR_PEP_ID=MMETSP1357-20121228/6937_1 /TAXON_ID=77926 /ORGANISM="Hemiselmis rufescens, Strain PCC563" /LENGTH=215 /DNA_ID=CAMNT_0014391745 /DNA_START=20 /DNA_END=667 /DNA_ORIENTATION=-